MITLKKINISHLLVIVTVVFFAHRANALLITQSFDIENEGSSDINLLLNPFDVSLGTLTSVFIDISAPSRIWSDQFECAAVDSFCTVWGFASLDFLTGDAITSKRYTSENYNTFLSGESKPFTVSMTPYWFYKPGEDLSSFSANSPRLVAHDQWRCERNCSGGGIGSGTQTLRGTLTYRYVPVPATLALLALGLVGLGVSRRA